MTDHTHATYTDPFTGEQRPRAGASAPEYWLIYTGTCKGEGWYPSRREAQEAQLRKGLRAQTEILEI